MQEPIRIHIESSFNEFIKQFDGELVSDLLPPNPSENADYLFRKENVVAELKCLEKDILEQDDSQSKIDALYEKWMRKGLVGVVAGTVTINSATLPMECQRELYSFIKKPIKRAIEKANRQIKQTKAHFNRPNAAGLLFLANDGNYSLESGHIIDIARDILSRHYSSIDAFVYLTVNMRAMYPGYHRDVNVWVPKYRSYNESLIKWVDRMAEAWGKYYAKKIGQDVPIHSFKAEDQKTLDFVKFIKPVKAVDRTTRAFRPKKTGRNEVCFCGSGSKYKKCHGAP
jgi:hypothetical protein